MPHTNRPISLVAGLALLLAAAPASAQVAVQPAAPAAYGAPAPGYGPAPAAPAAPPQPAPYAQPQAPAGDPSYRAQEIVDAGHKVFGEVAGGLAGVVEHAVSRYGLPNGYIVGEEASGAIFGGARYGEGVLYTKNAGQHRVYWQGPSLGFDIGANGDRVMMLVYNLPSIDALFERFVGINGSAYAVAGIGMTVLSRRGISVVPIVSGVGARLGVNVGYLKFTTAPTWNPF